MRPEEMSKPRVDGDREGWIPGIRGHEQRVRMAAILVQDGSGSGFLALAGGATH